MTNKQRYESFLRWEAMIARQVARKKGCKVADLYKKVDTVYWQEVLLMSVSHHADMLETFFDEEMELMEKTGMDKMFTPEALQEHCEYIARERFEDLCQ